MGLMDLLTNFAETNERHQNKRLITRYYRSSYKKIKNVIIDYANEFNYIVSNIDDKHFEIFIQSTKFHIIITILQNNPLETAVDVKVQTYKVFGLNKPKSVIEDLFDFLDKKLEFKGVGLHK